MEAEKETKDLASKLSFHTIKNQVLQNAYGNNQTFIAKLDPRTLFVWYLFYGLTPWFISSIPVLLGLFCFVALTTKLAKTVPLILFVFCLGVFSQTGFLFIFTFLFGGSLANLLPIIVLTLKISIVSLASICAFASMDPDKLALGLIAIHLPDQFAFSVSFAYRILPILMDEYQSILLSYKIRGHRPDSKGLMGKLRNLKYQIILVMKAFYPLMLNMAKRSRTTVEAMEIKGYYDSLKNKKVRKIKLKKLIFRRDDYLFLAGSLLYFAATFVVSHYL